MAVFFPREGFCNGVHLVFIHGINHEGLCPEVPAPVRPAVLEGAVAIGGQMDSPGHLVAAELFGQDLAEVRLGHGRRRVP